MLLSFINVTAQNQMKVWYMNQNFIDFSASQTVTPLTIPTPITADLAGGVYGPGPNNPLLFYVNDNAIYDRLGNTLMNLMFTTVGRGTELVIVPVPGSCTKYYVIYAYQTFGCTPHIAGVEPGIEYVDPLCTHLHFTEVDMDLNGGLGGVGPNMSDVLIESAGSECRVGLAVGKLRSNNTRFLYVVYNNNYNGGTVNRYTIGSAGINFTNTLFSTTIDEPFLATFELDLSPDESMLALGNLKFAGNFNTNNSDVTIIHLQPNGDLNPFLGIGGFTRITMDATKQYTGIEFSPDNLKLFVGVNGVGIRWIDLTTYTPQPVISILSVPYGNSQLETAFDAAGNYKIYVASSPTDIGSIDPFPPIPTFTPNAITSVNPFVVNPIASPYVNQQLPGFLLLPDQVDGENYDSRITPQCCGLLAAYDRSTELVNYGSSAQTWTPGLTNNPFASVSGTVTIRDELRIPSGKNITMQGMIFEFGPNGKIIIERGAKLTLNNSILRGNSTCPNSIWQGIEVWGNRNLSQSNTSSSGQGTLIIIDGQIWDAHDAITTIQDTPSGWDWNFTGGIVRADRGTFLNCGRCSQFLSYRNFNPNNPTTTLNNISYFKDCNFYTNSNYNYSALGNPFAFISMYDVRGIKFYGDNFVNQAPSLIPGARGLGIISIDAQYVVGSTTSSCRFENLFYGIEASSYNPLTTVNIVNNDFVQNQYGVLLNGMDYLTFNLNRIEVGTQLFSYGAYLNSCSHYQFESNGFISTSPIDNAGLLINNSGTAPNIVYNNTFTKLNYGTIALNNNDGPTYGDGLRLNCNDYINNGYDIFVGGNTLSQIGLLQGVCSGNPLDAVRNTYSALCVTSENQYAVDETVVSQQIVHSSFLPGPDITDPVCKDNLVFNSMCNFNFNKQAYCPSSFNCNPACQFMVIQQYITDINQLKLQIDGGNTTALLDSINSNMSNGQLKNLLLSYSPFLSDEVLIATINRTNPLPPEILKDILLANSSLTQTVMNAVIARIPALPSGIINQLNNAQTGVSARQELEQKISLKEANIDLAYDQMIRFYINDTISDRGMDSVIAILGSLNRDEAKCQKAAAQIAIGDTTNAKITIDEIMLDPDHQQFCSYLNLLLKIRQSLDQCLLIKHDSLKEAEARGIATDLNNPYCVNAQVMLEFAFNERIQELIILPNPISNRMANPDQGENPIPITNVFPNPASKSVTIYSPADTKDANGVFEIYSLDGQLLKREIFPVGVNTEVRTGELPAGVYLYIIRYGEIISERNKLIIIH